MKTMWLNYDINQKLKLNKMVEVILGKKFNSKIVLKYIDLNKIW